MTAYVSIRPMDEPRIRVICAPCDGDAPFDFYKEALACARLHNQTEHPKKESS